MCNKCHFEQIGLQCPSGEFCATSSKQAGNQSDKNKLYRQTTENQLFASAQRAQQRAFMQALIDTGALAR